MRRAVSSTTARPSGSFARAAEKIARASNGGAELGVERALLRQARRECADRARARIDVLPQPDEREVDLTGSAVMAPVQVAAQHETGTHARADREEGEVVHAAGDAAPLLADGGEVDVVLEAHRDLEAPSQLRPEGVALETRHAGRQADAAGCRVDDPGHADDRAVDPRRVGSLSWSRARRGAARSCRARRVASSPRISTSWRARISPERSQIAPRRKRAPTSSPSTSAASGTGSKKTAP